MEEINNKFGKFFGPSFTYTGYALLAAGLLAISYSLTSLVLIIPGIFIAFTYTGTIIDVRNKRVKPYTSLFGVTRTGKWIEISTFSRFSIVKSTQRYTSYSRGSVRFDMNIPGLNLMLMNREGTKKVVLNKFHTFEEAQKEMDEFSALLFPGNENLRAETEILPG